MAQLASPPEMRSVKALTPEKDHRLDTLDATRFVAAMGVIWTHALYGWSWRQLGAFSVPFFVIAAVMLVGDGLRRNPDRPWTGYVRKRFLRVYVPFLVWSIIYFMLKNVQDWVHLTHRGNPDNIGMLLFGTEFHLWFSPFIFVGTTLAFLLIRSFYRLGRGGYVWAASWTLAGIVVAWFSVPIFDTYCGMRFGLTRALYALPAFCWALALTPALPTIRNWLGQRSVAFWILALTIAAHAVIIIRFERDVWKDNIGGVLLLLFALTPWPRVLTKCLAWGGRYAFGIYMIHEVGLWGFRKLLYYGPESSLPILPSLGKQGNLLLLFALIASFSTVATILLTRFKFARWVMPG